MWEYEVSNAEMVDIKPRLGRLQPVGLMSYYNSCATVTRRWNCCTSHYCGNHRRESLNFSCCCSCYSKLYYSVEKHHFQLKYFFSCLFLSLKIISFSLSLVFTLSLFKSNNTKCVSPILPPHLPSLSPIFQPGLAQKDK